ncbi:MAG: hypothetical protein AAF557_02035 [Pseudomonadota bacterium]
MALEKISVAAAMLAVSLPFHALGQAQPAQDQGQQFSADDAILDTSILFAIGAHQAEQTLRSAFGWATFQEGLVDGVYFRFDPDGYARFAQNPRLDQDAFEVVCAPRSRVCAAKKGELEVALTPRSEIQITVAGAQEKDAFSVTDGQTELPLPPRVFQPLDIRLETILAAGGELIVRRDGNDFRRIPLLGFNAVATYLRWVASGQDSTVFPRGWPVPSEPVRLTGAAQPAFQQPTQPQQPQVPAYQQIAQQRQQVVSQGAPQSQQPQPVAVAAQESAPAQPQQPVAAPAQDGNMAASITQLQAQLEELSKMMVRNGGVSPNPAPPAMVPQGQPVQPVVHGQIPHNVPQTIYPQGNPAHQGYPPQQVQPNAQGQWQGTRLPAQGSQDWNAYRDLLAARRAGTQLPRHQMPGQNVPGAQYPHQYPAQQHPMHQHPVQQQLPEQQPDMQPNPEIDQQTNSTERRLEALFARLNEIESRGGTPQSLTIHQQINPLTGGKTKQPAGMEADPAPSGSRQQLQPGSTDGSTSYGSVSPMDARIERLEEMLSRLLAERQPEPSEDRVDLGAGVYIERELVEEIIAELDGEIGIAGTLQPVLDPVQPLTPTEQMAPGKSETKAKAQSGSASPEEDEFKTLKDYLSNVLSKEEAIGN